MLKEHADVTDVSDFHFPVCLHHDSSLWSSSGDVRWNVWLGALEAGDSSAGWDVKKASITRAKPIEERWEPLPSVRGEGAAVNPCKHASPMDASEGKASGQIYPTCGQQQRLVLRFHQNLQLTRSLHVCRPRAGAQKRLLTHPVGGANESRSYFTKDKRKSHFP